MAQSGCGDSGHASPPDQNLQNLSKGKISRESQRAAGEARSPGSLPQISHAGDALASPGPWHLLQVRNEGLQPVQLQVGEAIELREEGHGVVLLCHWAQTREG